MVEIYVEMKTNLEKILVAEISDKTMEKARLRVI